MLGVKHEVFQRALGNRWLRYYWRRIVRFDKNNGLLSAGMPLAVTMAAMLTVTTVVLDRQYELRDLRARSMSRHEANLEEEHQALREFLKGTEDEYEMKQIPDRFRLASAAGNAQQPGGLR
eukprot:TRINITY_DN80761_c0_g1_i1.p1 TRINITY_DN80761_c0_g1~~TRINITY_DN80761_c0_g1_i1.p1  ORF type:complete len:121 (-),score=19.04 TRINITY_DN80761_c0_g1_i1:103-465(-)